MMSIAVFAGWRRTVRIWTGGGLLLGLLELLGFLVLGVDVCILLFWAVLTVDECEAGTCRGDHTQ